MKTDTSKYSISELLEEAYAMISIASFRLKQNNENEAAYNEIQHIIDLLTEDQVQYNDI